MPQPQARNSREAAPWALSFDRTVPYHLRRWLAFAWRAEISTELAALHLAHLRHDEVAVPPEPAGTAHTVLIDGVPLRVTAAGELYRLDDSSGGCQFDAAQSPPVQLTSWGSKPELALYLALTEILRLHGWISLHCSAVVEPGQKVAKLFLGRSGDGKTWRLLQLLRAGAMPLAEDRLWLRAADGLCVARDDSLRLLPDTRAAFADLLQGEGQLEADGKFRFRYTELRLSVMAPTPICCGEILVLPTRGAPAAEQHSPALQAVKALWEAAGLPLTPQARQLGEQFVAQFHARIRL